LFYILFFVFFVYVSRHHSAIVPHDVFSKSMHQPVVESIRGSGACKQSRIAQLEELIEAQDDMIFNEQRKLQPDQDQTLIAARACNYGTLSALLCSMLPSDIASSQSIASKAAERSLPNLNLGPSAVSALPAPTVNCA
jgi:hypothetical protein